MGDQMQKRVPFEGIRDRLERA